MLEPLCWSSPGMETVGREIVRASVCMYTRVCTVWMHECIYVCTYVGMHRSTLTLKNTCTVHTLSKLTKNLFSSSFEP